MSRALKRLHGTGSGGAWVDGDDFTMDAGFTPLRDFHDLMLAQVLQRNLFVGGSDVIGIDASSSGDKDLVHAVPWAVDNSNNQISGFSDAPPSGSAATIVVQVRFLVRVSDPAVSVTPKVRYGSAMDAITSVATIGGATACTDDDETYSGANQIQTVSLTLPTGLKYFKPQVEVGGTPADGLLVWARAIYDCYVSLP